MLHMYIYVYFTLLKIYHKFIQKLMSQVQSPHSAWTKIQGASFNTPLPKAFDFAPGETSAIWRKRRKASATSASWSHASLSAGNLNPPNKNHTLPKTHKCLSKKGLF